MRNVSAKTILGTKFSKFLITCKVIYDLIMAILAFNCQVRGGLKHKGPASPRF